MKRIKLAGLPIEIHTLYDLPRSAEDYMTEEEPAFTVRITEQDMEREREKSRAECAYEGICCSDYSPAELHSTAVYRKIAMKLPEYDALVFHGSAVAVGQRAFLFAAPSGTGKTFHTRLWLKNIEGSYVINGDKPILRVIDGTPCVCGTPWMGKEGFGCNRIVPLSAVCFLNRGTENRIERISFAQAFPRLISQSFRPENAELLTHTLSLLKGIGQSTPLYELFCRMDDEAAKVAYGGMSGDNI